MKSKRDVFKPWLVKEAVFSGDYGLPTLEPCNTKPDKAVPFHNALRTQQKGQWVHFYVDDYRFECLWNNPNAYLERLAAFDGVITPDYSLYRDMPLAMQIWNTYRGRALGYWLQSKGICIIPNIRWGDTRTYQFCFDGIAKNSTVSISTNGCLRSHLDRYYFKLGLAELNYRLAPARIINYSYTPDDIFLPYKRAGVEIIQIPNYHDTIRGRILV